MCAKNNKILSNLSKLFTEDCRSFFIRTRCTYGIWLTEDDGNLSHTSHTEVENVQAQHATNYTILWTHRNFTSNNANPIPNEDSLVHTPLLINSLILVDAYHYSTIYYSKTLLARPSLARQTRLSPRQCLGPISSNAFSLDKPPPSPLALATTLKHRTLCNLTSITRQWEPLNASQHDQPAMVVHGCGA